MSYVGGKSLSAGHILAVLNDPIFDNMDYMEPFVGYAHVLRRVIKKRSYTASDNNALLVKLLRGIQNGRPIPHISKVEYDILKNEKTISLRRAVAAFTYSFNGKEWGGYTTIYNGATGQRRPPEERKRYYEKLRLNNAFQRTSIQHCCYTAIQPHNKLIYCDPPYAGTTSYGGDFDHYKFWQTMRKWSQDNVVFVSEYAAPSDFICVASRNKAMSLRGAHRKQMRTENLYMHPKCNEYLSLRG